MSPKDRRGAMKVSRMVELLEEERPLPTPDEVAQLNADRSQDAMDRATAALAKARIAYRKAERTQAKARELRNDAFARAGRLVSA